MALTLADAAVAMNAVLNKYKSYLDPLVVAGVQNKSVGQMFRILPQSQYTPYFNSVFKNFFAAINVVALGGIKKMIDLAHTATDASPAIACPAFTAPAVNVTDRVIYVNADSNITIGTLYHEFVHFLEHGNFYPEYYSLGGNNPKILEGVTEYLTRAVDTSIDAERKNGGKYKAFLDHTLNLNWGSDSETFTKMTEIAFQGKMSALPS
jgi:hypothetical protein